MTDPVPQRTRVRVDDTAPEPDPARTGCLWVGGILGVIVGVVVTFLAVPQILNFFFPTESIGVGETFEDDKLTISITSVEVSPLEPGFYVALSVHARSSWTLSRDNFVLVLTDGHEMELTQLAISDDSSGRTVPQGDSRLLLMFHEAGDADLPAPDSLHLEEPPVKFELPEPVRP